MADVSVLRNVVCVPYTLCVRHFTFVRVCCSGFLPTAIVRIGMGDASQSPEGREVANLFGDVVERMYK